MNENRQIKQKIAQIDFNIDQAINNGLKFRSIAHKHKKSHKRSNKQFNCQVKLSERTVKWLAVQNQSNKNFRYHLC